MDSLTDNTSSRDQRQHTARDVLNIIFKRWKLFFGLPILIIGLIVAGTLAMPKIYEASTQLKIEETNYDNIGISGVQNDGGGSFARMDQLINSEINVVQGTVVLQEVARRLNLPERWNFEGSENSKMAQAVGRLDSMISVEPRLDSWVIGITVKSEDPELAAEVANAIAEVYIEKSISLKTTPQASQFYKDKLDKEREDLKTLQEQFKQLRRDNRVANYDGDVDQAMRTRGMYENRLADVNTQILSKQAKLREIDSFLQQSGDDLIPFTEIAQVRIIEDLHYRLVNLRLELDSLRSRYTDDERQVKLARQQITELEDQIRREVRNIARQERQELTKLRNEKAQLQGQINQINNEMIAQTSIEGEYENLEQEIRDKQSIISDLNRKYTDSLYAGESDVRLGRVKQISEAMKPNRPVFPNMQLNLIVGIPLAFLFSLAVVMLLEYFDRRFSRPETVERVLGLPVLATIKQMDMRKNPLFK